MLGHFGMIPLKFTMIPGFGRTVRSQHNLPRYMDRYIPNPSYCSCVYINCIDHLSYHGGATSYYSQYVEHIRIKKMAS